MAQLQIDDIEDAVLGQLERQARANDRSLQEEVKAILGRASEAAKPPFSLEQIQDSKKALSLEKSEGKSSFDAVEAVKTTGAPASHQLVSDRR